MKPKRNSFSRKREYFVPGPEASQEKILTELKEAFPLMESVSRKKKQTFYDTFDYKLYGKGLLLVKEGRKYALLKSDDGDQIATLGTRAKRAPKFWWDFPDGELREELSHYLDVRALMPLVDIERSSTRYRILNEDEKTVSYLDLEEITTLDGGEKKASARLFAVQPVRGYEEESDKIAEYLFGIGLERTPDDLLKIAFESLGRKPGDYSSKINVKLEPDMPASTAAKVILLSLLETIRANEKGIIDDIDSEFLHDYRVSVRRTRSVLTLIKGVFPEKVKERYKKDFAMLGKSTNRLRDLDIYLIKRKQYEQMLPPELRAGLNPLFSMLEKERQSALDEFVTFLNSPEYERILQSWGKFLKDTKIPEDGAVNAHTPILKLAKTHIRKRYKKALKLGEKIDENSPDTDLHALRIECKKLRYFLEFFESLFPEKQIRQAVKQLKALQDNLGDFNDLHVQQESLKDYVSKMNSRTKEGKDSIISAGGLISQLYSKQLDVRSEFEKRFEEFSNKETEALFENLFSTN